MSKSIDERVVQLQFDNKDFEKNAQTSLGTLDKLKGSLDVLGTGEALKGLGNVDTSGFNTLSVEIDNTGHKFNMLEEIAVGVCRRIGEAITNWVTPKLKEFTVGPMIDGWEKYEEKTRSVQTIMAATRQEFEDQGEQMEVVTEQLEKLNWYTDETSFKFTDMTNNIGKFTSAGVDLDTSVTAMMGITNWAGLSGASVEQASHAMYNLAQAMGSGVVRLQDWKSIENANMATQEFKTTVLETAVEMGQMTKVGEGLYQTLDGAEVSVEAFNESLSEKWLTGEILNETLGKFGAFTEAVYENQDVLGDYYDTTSKFMDDIDEYIATGTIPNLEKITKATGMTTEEITGLFDELSDSTYELGRRAFRASQEAITFSDAMESVADAASTTWMRVFEAIFGNYQESKVLWTDLANSLWDVFVGPVDTLAEIIELWSQMGGNAYIIEGVINLFGLFADVLDAVAEAFNEVFIGETEYEDVISGVAEKMTDASKGFRDFTALLREKLAVVLPVITKGLSFLLGIIKTVGTVVSSVVKYFFDFGKSLIEAVTSSQTFQTIMGGLQKVFSQFVNALKHAGDYWEFFAGVIKNTEGFKKFSKVISDIYSVIKNFAGGVISKAVAAISKFFKTFSVASTTLGGIFSLSDALGKALSWLADIFVNVANAVYDFAHSDVVNKVATAVGNFVNKLVALGQSFSFTDTLKTLWSWFQKLAEIVGIVAVAIAYFGGEAISKAVEAVKNFISEVMLDGKEVTLTNVLEKLSEWFEKIKKFAGDAGEKIAEFGKAISDAFKDIKENGIDLGKLSEAFENAKKKIGEFFEKIKGLFKPKGSESLFKSITSLFTKIGKTIKGALEKIDFSKFLDAAKVGTIAWLVVTIIQIVRRFKKFSKGLADIPTSLVDTMESAQKALKAYRNNLNADSILKVAAAIGIIAAALWALSKIPADDLGKAAGALVIIAAALVAVTLAFAKFKNAGGNEGAEAVEMFSKTVGKALKRFATFFGIAAIITSIAVAIGILAGIIYVLKDVPAADAWKVVGEIAGLAGILVGAAILLSKFAQHINLGTVAAIAALAIGIGILTGAMFAMKFIGWEEWAQVVILLIALGGAVALVGAAGIQSLSGAAAILALAVGIGILAGVALLIGDHLDTVGAGIVAMGVAVAGLVGLGAIATIFAAGLTAIGIAAAGVGVGALLFAAAVYIIVKVMPELKQAFNEVFKKIQLWLPIIKEKLEEFWKTVKEWGSKLVKWAKEAWKKIKKFFADMGPFLEGAWEVISGIFASAWEWISGVFSDLGGWFAGVWAEISKTAEESWQGLQTFWASVVEFFAGVWADIIQFGSDLITTITNIATGVWQVILDIGPVLGAAIEYIFKELGSVILNGIVDLLDPFLLKIPGIGDDLSQMLHDSVGKAAEGATQGAEESREKLNTAIDTLMKDAEGVISSNTEGMKKATDTAMSGVDQSLTENESTLTGKAKTAGKNITGAVGEGLNEDADLITTGANGMPSDVVNKITKTLDDGREPVRTSAKGLKDEALEAITDKSSEFLSTGTTQGSDYNQGLASIWETLSITGNATGALPINAIGAYTGEWSATGTTQATGYNQSLADQHDTITTTSDGIGKDAWDKVDDYVDDWKTTGTKSGIGFNTKLAEKKRPILETAEDIAQKAHQKVKDYEDDWKTAGTDTGEGYAAGIRATIRSVIDAAGSIASAALNKLKTFLGIASPSKEFAWAGKMSALGFAEGMYESSGLVEKSSSSMAQAALDSLRDYLGSDELANDLNLSPVITPVLNLDAVRSGSEAMNELIGSSAFGTYGLTRGGYFGNTNHGITNTNNYGGVTIYVTGNDNASAYDIADEVINRINIEYQRQKAVWV